MRGLLEFLRIAGNLKTVQRSGWIRSGVQERIESVADHSWRVAVMAMVVDAVPEVDRMRAIKMGLLHDLQEALVGDIMPQQYSGVTEEVKHEMEREAVVKLKGMLGGVLGDEMMGLWEEYEAGVTPTAKFIKDLDKFEMLLQADSYERSKGVSLQDFFDSASPKIQSPPVVDLISLVMSQREGDRK